LVNSNISWTLRVRNGIYKELAKLPPEERGRITKVIENLPHNPFVGDVEKIKDEKNTWRRRIGNYRIFYEIVSRDRIIYVFQVERRTSNTY